MTKRKITMIALGLTLYVAPSWACKMSVVSAQLKAAEVSAQSLLSLSSRRTDSIVNIKFKGSHEVLMTYKYDTGDGTQMKLGKTLFKTANQPDCQFQVLSSKNLD